MKTEMIYVSRDGMKWSSENECLAHERRLDEIEHLKKVRVEVRRGVEVDADDVAEFFNKLRCEACPFENNCRKLTDHTQRVDNDVISLCDVIFEQIES